MTENERKLLIDSSDAIQVMMSRDGVKKAAEDLERLCRTVASERAEATAEDLRKVGLYETVEDFIEAKSPSEPTATEPEVPVGGDVPVEKNLCIETRDGKQCKKKRVYTSRGGMLCRGPHDFGPEVPSEGEYRHCNTCGMRSHGTNAELRSQVDELRAKLKDAEDSAGQWQFRYKIVLKEVKKKAGDA